MIMKTKEEILKSNLTNISCLNADDTFNSVCKAMQEYADQQLAEYKSKLKEQFKIQYLTIGFPSYPELCKLVDITQL